MTDFDKLLREAEERQQRLELEFRGRQAKADKERRALKEAYEAQQRRLVELERLQASKAAAKDSLRPRGAADISFEEIPTHQYMASSEGKKKSYYTPKELAEISVMPIGKLWKCSSVPSSPPKTDTRPARRSFSSNSLIHKIAPKPLAIHKKVVNGLDKRSKAAKNFAANNKDLIVLNQKKRDLRTIEEIQLDLKREKMKEKRLSSSSSAIPSDPSLTERKTTDTTRTETSLLGSTKNGIHPRHSDSGGHPRSGPTPEQVEIEKMKRLLHEKDAKILEMQERINSSKSKKEPPSETGNAISATRKLQPRDGNRSCDMAATKNRNAKKTRSYRHDDASSVSSVPRRPLAIDDNDFDALDDGNVDNAYYSSPRDEPFYGKNYSSIIGKIFNYDRSRYVDEEKDDIDDMESDYRHIRREENLSAKIAILEDDREEKLLRKQSSAASHKRKVNV